MENKIKEFLVNYFNKNAKSSVCLCYLGIYGDPNFVEVRIDLPPEISKNEFCVFVFENKLKAINEEVLPESFNSNDEFFKIKTLKISQGEGNITGYTGHYDFEAGIDTGNEIYGLSYSLEEEIIQKEKQQSIF